jgi:hypothetical protein
VRTKLDIVYCYISGIISCIDGIISPVVSVLTMEYFKDKFKQFCQHQQHVQELYFNKVSE